MYDMHYDLLTILYYNFKNGNPLSDTTKMINDVKNIYHNNILGGIINLYFMSEKEMKEELGIEKEDLNDVLSMFQKSIDYLYLLKQNGVIPDSIDFLYSIEGCDYIKTPNDLEQLYNLGLRSILPVWNEKNIYGSGNRSDDGLTELGKELIIKAVDLGIMIDVSHANENTFNDILDVLENERKNGKEFFLIASHSNSRTLCDRKRNLNDGLLKRLKDLGGYIGLFTNGNFLSLDNESISCSERQENFIKHLDYIRDIIGFSDDKIVISTDDMNFNPDMSYHHLEAFDLNSISICLRKKLESKYSEEFTDKVMVENAKVLINRLNKKGIKNNIK